MNSYYLRGSVVETRDRCPRVFAMGDISPFGDMKMFSRNFVSPSQVTETFLRSGFSNLSIAHWRYLKFLDRGEVGSSIALGDTKSSPGVQALTYVSPM